MKNKFNETKKYIYSFSKPKKVVFIISCVLFFFEAIAPIQFLIINNFFDPLSNHSIFIEWFCACITESFLTSDILAVYLYAFPIIYFFINFIFFVQKKYNTLLIIIDFLFQIINPLIILSGILTFIGIIDSIHPQF